MEIISYLKGKKSQEVVKEVHKVVGQDSYKNGVRDVVDVWTDADERISKLEQKHKDDKLIDRIEALTDMVAINLMKQHLFVGVQADKQRMQHNQLVFQDFDSTGDYVPTKSKNIQLTTKGIKPTNALVNGEVVLKPEPTVQLMKLLVQTVHSNTNGLALSLSIANIEHYEGVAVTSTAVSFVKKDATHNTYTSEGFIRFKAIEMSEEYSVASALYNTTLQSSNVIYEYALSEDGILFGEYNRLLVGSKLSGFVSIRIRFLNTLSDGTRTIDGSSIVQNQSTSYTASGTASNLKTSYSGVIARDATWTGEGSVLKYRVTNSEWDSIKNFTIN